MSDRVKTLEPIQSLPTTDKILRQFPLLQSILESFTEGLLILTESGEMLYANELARQINQQLSPSSQTPISAEIWRVCASLIESRSLFPNQKLILDSEAIALDSSTVIRIQAQWFSLAKVQQACILVHLEDLCALS